VAALRAALADLAAPPALG